MNLQFKPCMLIDIFSSFDPITTTPQFSLIHISFLPIILPCLLFLIIAHSAFWLNYSRFSHALFIPSNFIWDQLTQTISFNLKGLSSILTPLFSCLIILNLFGLIPYVFSTTSHLSFTLVLGLPLWLSLIISGILTNPSSWAASLLPGGAPRWLNPFLVLIETIRISVRPITLRFRLAANITAGHIVLTLIGIYLAYRIFTLSSFLSATLILIQIGYIMFEIGICLIQAFIFCLLLSLYSDDHPI